MSGTTGVKPKHQIRKTPTGCWGFFMTQIYFRIWTFQTNRFLKVSKSFFACLLAHSVSLISFHRTHLITVHLFKKREFFYFILPPPFFLIRIIT